MPPRVSPAADRRHRQTKPAAQAARLCDSSTSTPSSTSGDAARGPNVSSDTPNIQRNADLIAKMIATRRLSPQLVSVPGGNPVVVARLRTPGATRTIGLYRITTAQPLDPKEWALRLSSRRCAISRSKTAAKPCRCRRRLRLHPEWRLYARGSGDDKADCRRC
jgi:hypothetical protein